MRCTEEWKSSLKFEAGTAVEQLCLAISVTRLNSQSWFQQHILHQAARRPSLLGLKPLSISSGCRRNNPSCWVQRARNRSLCVCMWRHFKPFAELRLEVQRHFGKVKFTWVTLGPDLRHPPDLRHHCRAALVASGLSSWCVSKRSLLKSEPRDVTQRWHFFFFFNMPFHQLLYGAAVIVF